MNRSDWWNHLNPALTGPLAEIWIPVGLPGYAGPAKEQRRVILDERFGVDGWRQRHFVRGQIVSKIEAMGEYEEAYRRYLRDRPALVHFLVRACGNVYDDQISNVYDGDYAQPHSRMNHYQDISVRRVIAELVDDPDWPEVVETPVEEVELIDLNDGSVYRLPRAAGFGGTYLLQIREPDSPGFFLNPAVVPVHDPTLITTLPGQVEWYHHEGCSHLSIEAFWQMSKVIEVRYDRFLALGNRRGQPLEAL